MKDHRVTHLARHEKTQRSKHTPSGWMVAMMDVALIGVALCIFSLFHHVLPRTGNAPLTEITRPDSTAGSRTEVAADDGSATDRAEEDGTWGKKFAGKFLKKGEAPQIGELSYVGYNCRITIQKTTIQVRKQNVVYFVADIYLRNLDAFRTAFAKGTYGKAITQTVPEMAKANGAILAVSGDYYGTNEQGTVIRNGKLYRRNPADVDAGVLYWDGSMETFSPTAFDVDAILKKSPYQAWTFGPMLLQNGQAMTQFNSSLIPANPRCAIGYYEPGHYCFVLVDGRQPDTYSAGLRMEALSALMKELGCQQAYNLDGGQSAMMVFNGRVINQPPDNGRRVSDIVYIGEGTAAE